VLGSAGYLRISGIAAVDAMVVAGVAYGALRWRPALRPRRRRRELDDRAIANLSASPRITRATRVSRKDTGAMQRRLRRLQVKLTAIDKPIVWLRAGPGTGKSRLLRALRDGVGAARLSRWRLLDTPSPEQARALLNVNGIAAAGHAGSLLPRAPAMRLRACC